jgi:hypothetical protein
MKAFVSRLAHKLPAALWLMFQIPAMAADIGFVAVMKGQEFAQTSTDIVALGEWRIWNDTGEVQNEGEHGEPPYLFQTLAFGTAPDSLVSGSVTVPGGAVLNLQRDVEDAESTEISVESGYDSPLNLNTARPDGSYTVQLVTKNEGMYSTVLPLTGGAYPPVPHVTNFNALQSATASLPITVQWSAMGGTAQDFILCQVMQLGGANDDMILWQSGAPGTPGALDGTSTQVVIPANTLNPGTDYRAEVMFVKTSNVQTSPALAIAGYYKLTGFRIRTAALPGTPLGSTLLRSNPLTGWSWVPVDSAIAFHFSHPMSPAHISIDWTKDGGPLSTGTFSYHWTQGNTVLLCRFSSDLPPDSEIGWTLNLPGFRDAANFPLSGSPTGWFRTGTDIPESPPDVGFISLLKTKYHIQTGTTPVADGRFEAGAEVEANAPNRLKSATLTALTGGRSGPFHADPWDGDEYEVPGEYGSKTDLDRFYPNGDYQFALEGLEDGAQSVTLSLGATDQYPPAPAITNLAALQAIDPAVPVTVTWNALAGWTNDMETLGSGDGWIEFEILDPCGREVLWVEGSEMSDGVSCVIPAGTLRPGRSYRANVFFIRITDIDAASYPDAFAVAAFESQTTFNIQTTGQPEMPSLLLQLIGSTARVTATGGDPESTYILETSSDLERWTLLDAYWNPPGGSAHQFDDTDAQYFKSRFYRVTGPYCESPMMPPMSIQGTVWTNSSRTTPVAGAVVGTSLDGQTTVTDAQGRFFLITGTPSQNGTASYTINITSGALTKNFGPWSGDQPRNQVFEME